MTLKKYFTTLGLVLTIIFSGCSNDPQSIGRELEQDYMKTILFLRENVDAKPQYTEEERDVVSAIILMYFHRGGLFNYVIEKAQKRQFLSKSQTKRYRRYLERLESWALRVTKEAENVRMTNNISSRIYSDFKDIAADIDALYSLEFNVPRQIRKTNYMLFIILGAIIIVAIGGIWLNKKKTLAPSGFSNNYGGQYSERTAEHYPPPSPSYARSSAFERRERIIKLPFKLQEINTGQVIEMNGLLVGEKYRVTLGRNVLSGDEALAHVKFAPNETTISRMQAELYYKNGLLECKNLSNTNQTLINNQPLAVGETRSVREGDVLRLGRYYFKIIRG